MHWSVRVGIGLTCLIALAMSAEAHKLAPGFDELYASRSLTPPTAEAMTVCYGFVCRRRFYLQFTRSDRATVSALFRHAHSPAAERAAAARALAWLDRRVGPLIGTSRRVARADFRAGDDAHNFGCIDASTDATSMLLVLTDWGLLRFHRVGLPHYRGNLFIGQTPHNTAVLIDQTTHRAWSFDMWTRGYGQLPEVMPLERWMHED